jgi:hypothetical protein
VLVVHHVDDVVDRATGDFRLFQGREHFSSWSRAGPCRNGSIQLLLVHHPSGVVGHARIVGQVLPAHGGHQALVNRVAVAADDDELAVAAPIGIGRHYARQRRARGLAYHALAGVLRHHALHHVEHRFVDGRVNDLAGVPRLFQAVDAGEQDADDGVHRGQRVAHAQVRPHRRLAGETVHVAQAAHALADGREARAGGVGSGLPVTGNARVDELGMGLAQVLGTEPPLFHRARPEVLHQDVGLGGQLAHQVAALLAAQVDGDALLVAPEAVPPQGHAVLHHPPGADRVARIRRFDLDHFGAEVTEHAGGEGACQQLAEFQDPETVERPWGCRVVLAHSGRGRDAAGSRPQSSGGPGPDALP